MCNFCKDKSSRNVFGDDCNSTVPPYLQFHIIMRLLAKGSLQLTVATDETVRALGRLLNQVAFPDH